MSTDEFEVFLISTGASGSQATIAVRQIIEIPTNNTMVKHRLVIAQIMAQDIANCQAADL